MPLRRVVHLLTSFNFFSILFEHGRLMEKGQNQAKLCSNTKSQLKSYCPIFYTPPFFTLIKIFDLHARAEKQIRGCVAIFIVVAVCSNTK